MMTCVYCSELEIKMCVCVCVFENNDNIKK